MRENVPQPGPPKYPKPWSKFQNKESDLKAIVLGTFEVQEEGASHG